MIAPRFGLIAGLFAVAGMVALHSAAAFGEGPGNPGATVNPFAGAEQERRRSRR